MIAEFSLLYPHLVFNHWLIIVCLCVCRDMCVCVCVHLVCVHHVCMMWLGYLHALRLFPNHWQTDSLIVLVARNWASLGMDEAGSVVSPSNRVPHWASRDLISRGGGIDGWLWKWDLHLAGNNPVIKCTAAACGHCVAEWFEASRVQEKHGNEQRVLFLSLTAGESDNYIQSLSWTFTGIYINVYTERFGASRSGCNRLELNSLYTVFNVERQGPSVTSICLQR